LDSVLFGAPNFTGSCLWYQSNEDLSLVAFPLPLGSASARNDVLQFAKELAREVAGGRFRSLKVYGDADIVSALLYENVDIGEMYYVPQARSGDFLMDVSNLKEVGKSAARASERVKRQGYRVSENRSKTISAAQIDIVRQFFEDHIIAAVDRIFFSALPLWISRSDVRVFEIFSNGELVSFFLVHEWSPMLAFFLASFSMRGARNVGDATMSYLHQHYVRTGGRVYLGPPVDEENATFKRKWARDVGNGPTSGAIFSLDDDSNSLEHLSVWWSRAAWSHAGWT
jgi:hypothetical protein